MLRQLRKEIIVFSTNGAGTTGYSHANDEVGPLPLTIYEN